jgi:flagellar assembly protein FliH
MRLLSRVIKSFQYGAVLPAFPAEVESFDSPEDEEEENQPGEEAGEASPELSVPNRASPRPAEYVPPDKKSKEILEKAFQKAKQIVDSAQDYSTRQVRELNERMLRETEEAKKQGYSAGYAVGSKEGQKRGCEAGLRSGTEEGLRKAADVNRKNIEELAEMIQTVEKEKEKVLQRFGDNLQDLAVAIAKAILKKELEVDDKAMSKIILSAMDSYRNQAWLRIYVSDQTANILTKADNNIVERLKGVSENVKVVAAQGMSDGGCIIEMPDQVIDAGIDTQLRKIRNAIDTAATTGNG